MVCQINHFLPYQILLTSIKRKILYALILNKKGYFMKRIIILGAALLTTSSFATVSAITKAFDVRASKGTPVEIKGEHHINIDNHTRHNEHYTYTFTLCSPGIGCDNFQKRIMIPPGGNYRDDYMSHVVVRFRFPGIHPINATTTCVGGDFLNQEHHATAKVN
jgi:hypothetical protein